MSRLTNVLHLSDLHLKSPLSNDQRVILGGLKQDLEVLRNTSKRPDLIVVSGDIVDKADNDAAFEEALSLIVEIQQIVGVDEEHTILCAGNHDVKRSVVETNVDKLKTMRQAASSSNKMNELVSLSPYKDYAHAVLEDFYGLEQSFGASNRVRGDIFSSTYRFDDIGLAVVSLNSAVLCAGGLKSIESDERMLSIAESTLMDAVAPLSKGERALFVVHHPPEWLNEDSRKIFERVIGKYGRATLSGHMHYAKPQEVTSIGGRVLLAQSGALYSERDPNRDYWNGYSTVCLCLENDFARITYRRWFESRRTFGKAEDLKDNGEFFSSEEAQTFWQSTSPNFDISALEHWRSTVLIKQFQARLAELLSNTTYGAKFVEPDFEVDRPFKSENDNRIGSRLEIVSMKQVSDLNDNIVISARTETGKSTLLTYMAYVTAMDPYFVDKKNIPVIVNFSRIRNFPASIANAIRAELKGMPRDLNSDDMITSGMLTIMIDDVDFSNRQKRDALVKFVTKYPKCRYIITSSTPFIDLAALKPEIAEGVPFTKVTMRSMKRGQLLALVEGHGLTDPFAADQMVERVMRDASALNVPLTAVTGTFLIQIFREEPDSKVINQAALIERYIDICLEKYAPKDILPGAFDFKNKVDLLCYITERMIRDDVYLIDENEFTLWCINYLKNYGLNFSAQNIVDYFVKSRILLKEDGRIRFRLRVFASFFAATRMIDDAAFREYIFDSKHYLSFSHEIGFYCALNRRDIDKLKLVWDEFERLSMELYGDTDVNAQFCSTKLPERKVTEQELAQIHSSMNSESQIEEDRKALQEGTDFDDEAQDRGFKIEAPKSPAESWTAHLILLSGMIKHMELISNEDKTLYIRQALDGWVRFSTTSLAVVPELAKKRRVVFNGVTYKSTLSDDVPLGEFARRLTLYMPIAVARLATAFLGTEKLQMQLENGIGDGAEPLGRQFFRVAILADLGVDNFVAIAERAQATLRHNDYVHHVFGRKLYEVAVRFRMERNKLSRLKALVGGVFAGLHNTKKAGSARSGLMMGIEQQRLRIELEEKAIAKKLKDPSSK